MFVLANIKGAATVPPGYKNDPAIFIHVMGDKYNDSQTKIIWGKTIKELDTETKNKGVVFSKTTLNGNAALLISAASMNVLENEVLNNKELKQLNDGPRYTSTASQILSKGVFKQSTHYATAFITLARAKGIPALLVKATAVKNGAVTNSPGHDFVEVYVDNSWYLIDPNFGYIYENYDVNNWCLPTIPGADGCIAFAKGLSAIDMGIREYNIAKLKDLAFRGKTISYGNPSYPVIKSNFNSTLKEDLERKVEELELAEDNSKIQINITTKPFVQTATKEFVPFTNIVSYANNPNLLDNLSTLPNDPSTKKVHKVDSKIKILLNSIPLTTDVDLILDKGTTLVPLRNIFEALGANVNWDSATRRITGIKDDKVIILHLNDVKVTINAEEITLAVPAKSINGKTLVPLRFIAESLGASVKWDGNSSSVIINN